MPSVVVTGSSRGIGAAIARRFAADGYDVVVNYHTSADAAEETARAVREQGAEAVVVEADVSDPTDAERLMRQAGEAFDRIDHLVNNAGIDQHVFTRDLTPDDFDRVMDTNVNSAFNCTKAALPLLETAAERATGGAAPTPSVTNVSSILAYTGAPIECHYAASKAGLLALTKSHATDFAPDIRVNAIAPGHIETDMTADRTPAEKEAELDEIPVGRFGQPSDIAAAAAYLRDAGFVTGETLNVNGGELMR